MRLSCGTRSLLVTRLSPRQFSPHGSNSFSIRPLRVDHCVVNLAAYRIFVHVGDGCSVSHWRQSNQLLSFHSPGNLVQRGGQSGIDHACCRFGNSAHENSDCRTSQVSGHLLAITHYTISTPRRVHVKDGDLARTAPVIQHRLRRGLMDLHLLYCELFAGMSGCREPVGDFR